MYRLRNASYYSAPLDRYLDDPAKPAVVNNQPVEDRLVKPVSPWRRHFILGETRSEHGSVVTTWYQGETPIERIVAKNPTGFLHAADDRYLPGTPTNWDTSDVVNCLLWKASPGDAIANEVLQRALANAKTDGWDLMTVIAERKKTMQMILQLQQTFNARARRVASAWRDNDEAIRFLRGTNQTSALPTWLLARYGLRPLVYDIAALWDRLANELESQLFRVYARDSHVTSSTQDYATGLANPDRLPPGWTYTGGVQPTNPQGIGRVQTTVVSEMLAGAGVTPWLTNQLTLNPGNTAFELVPWLWVLDHFATIGDLVLAHTPVFDRKVEYLWVSTREITTYTSYASWYGSYPAGYAFPPGSPTTRRGVSQFSYSRETTIRAKKVVRRPVPVSNVPMGLYLNLRLDAAFLVDGVALYNSRHRALVRFINKQVAKLKRSR